MAKRYKNPYIDNLRRSPFHFLGWFFGVYERRTPQKVVPQDFTYPHATNSEHRAENPSVQWIGHCTFLLEVAGKNVLTDPIFSDRCSPLPFFGPKRRHPPAVELEDLPSIDVVLISHNHYDHLDAKSIKYLKMNHPQAKWVVPSGLRTWFSRRGIQNIIELDWWQEHLLFDDMIVTSVPAQHNSGRGLFDSNKSLWSGFVVSSRHEKERTKRFYFVGDTAYNPYDFKKIGRKFDTIDLCLCPIGTYEPDKFMRTVHSNPEDAVSIHEDVGANLSIGMHWKTFKLSSEAMNQPPYDLYNEMVKRKLNPKQFRPINLGVKVSW